MAESLQRDDGGRILRPQIIVFLFSLAVFLAAPVIEVSDSRYAALLSECFWRHRTAELDEYYKVPVPGMRKEIRHVAASLDKLVLATRFQQPKRHPGECAKAREEDELEAASVFGSIRWSNAHQCGAGGARFARPSLKR